MLNKVVFVLCVHKSLQVPKPYGLFGELFCYFSSLNKSGPLLSMKDVRTLGFHPKYLNLHPDAEQRFQGFGRT